MKFFHFICKDTLSKWQFSPSSISIHQLAFWHGYLDLVDQSLLIQELQPGLLLYLQCNAITMPWWIIMFEIKTEHGDTLFNKFFYAVFVEVAGPTVATILVSCIAIYAWELLIKRIHNVRKYRSLDDRRQSRSLPQTHRNSKNFKKKFYPWKEDTRAVWINSDFSPKICL